MIYIDKTNFSSIVKQISDYLSRFIVSWFI